ncbi:MAG: hypothetical protein M0Z92_03790 [Actinomycetota bacterium]|nr:hypothetical protein [Actinomycetota bacterium]
MAVAVASPTVTRPTAKARTVIARRTARRSLRSAVLWGYVFGVTVASSAYSYTTIYKTASERQRLDAVFGANRAVAALFGPAVHLDTVPGFTAYKSSMAVMIIGAVWGLMHSTRLLRGEEDAGRWDLLVSGETTLRQAVLQALSGFAAAAALVWAITFVITAAVGQASSVRIGVSASLYLATALVSSAVIFLAVGALTSQLAANRRRASSYAGVVLGISYGLRMVGDAVPGLHWLVWASPLGWVEELRPLTGSRPMAFLPITAFTLAAALAAIHFAGRRDVGGSILAERSSREARLRTLTGPFGLTFRLMLSSIISWVVAVAIGGALVGITAQAAGSTVVGSSVEQVFTRLGAAGAGAKAFLGVIFVILAMTVGYQAATQLSLMRSEEAGGRADHLLVGNVSRSRWFTGWLLAIALSLLASSLAAGLFTWAGASFQGSGLGIWSSLAAGMNIFPPALFILGTGALALGFLPRFAGAVMYTVLGWSALVELVGGFVGESHWALDTSLFHQMSAAPAVAPNWQTGAVLAGLGILMAIVGHQALLRRDLQEE